MESCARLIALIPGYAEGEICPADGLRISNHLQDCRSCRRRVESHRRFLEMLDRIPRAVPPADFRSSVMASVLASPLPVALGVRGGHLRLVRTILWIAGPAAAVSAVGAGNSLLSHHSGPGWGWLDPALSVEWMGGFGQFAFSFLLNIATRADVPALISFPHSPFGWGTQAAILLVCGCAAGAVGLGLLATARAILQPRSR